MKWYYSAGGAQAGPVSQPEFDNLVQTGQIGAETMVWREGMPDWVPYGDLATAGGGVAVAAASHACAECRRVFPESELIRYENAWICGACKPRFVQKLKEGIVPAGALVYAGFWIRAGAKFLDGIILQIANFALGLAFGVGFVAHSTHGVLLKNSLAIATGLIYSTYFNGRFGATPGKMALNLKIVRPDGAPITFARALGRYFAEIVSGLLLGIGFMMAGWDEEKRSLHDRICDTRVIRKEESGL